MAFRKRSAFEDLNREPPKNSYEAFERKSFKPLKDYDMRPHWLKNDDASNNPDHVERAGADEEEEESLTLLKKQMNRTAYDDVMDIVLGGQQAIHSRAVAAHEDRMSILRQFCGYQVWEQAEKDKAPGAAESVLVEADAFDYQGAPVKVAVKTSVSPSKKTTTTTLNSQNENSDYRGIQNTLSNLSSTRGRGNNNNNNNQSISFVNENEPLHVAILTPPYHGCIPLDDRHLSKGCLSYKMEKSIKQINDAVVQFQIANEIARENAEKEQLALEEQQQKQQLSMKNKQSPSKNNATKKSSQQHEQQVPIQQQTSQLSQIMEARMARERLLEEGLFTPFFQQDSVSGLGGVPWADPNATSPKKSSVTGGFRRYPDPYAFVIH
jgi:hypothetical protein